MDRKVKHKNHRDVMLAGNRNWSIARDYIIHFYEKLLCFVYLVHISVSSNGSFFFKCEYSLEIMFISKVCSSDFQCLTHKTN